MKDDLMERANEWLSLDPFKYDARPLIRDLMKALRPASYDVGRNYCIQRITKQEYDVAMGCIKAMGEQHDNK